MEQPSPPDRSEIAEPVVIDHSPAGERLRDLGGDDSSVKGRSQSARDSTSDGRDDLSVDLGTNPVVQSFPFLIHTQQRFTHRLTSFVLILIFGLALGLRMWGIEWGLPDQRKIFSYHPDEGVNLIQGVLVNGEIRPHLDLGFYNYGSVYFYGWQTAVALNRACGMIRRPATGHAAPVTDSPASMILAGRLLTAMAGALTVFVVFWLGCALFGRDVGFASASIYAVIPAGVVHSHFATVDIPATLLVSLALLFGARTLAEGKLRDVLMAGLFSGLAAATKYNTVLVIASPLAALFIRRKAGHGIPRYATPIMLATALVGFTIACPGIFLNWPKFSSDFLFELTKSGQGMGLLFTDTGNGWLFHLTSSLRFGLGVPLLLVSLAGVIFAFSKRTPQDWFLLSFLLFYYAAIGAAQVRFLRYVIPMFPVLAILGGRLLFERRDGRKLSKYISTAIGSIVILSTLVLSLALDRLMVVQDARDQALEYLASNVRQGSVIGFARTPWFDVPPLAPEFTAPSPSARRESARSLRYYTVRLPKDGTELDRRVLDPPLPNAIILSDIETQDWQRLNLPAWQPFRDVLAASYVPHVFENRPSLAGFDFGKPDYVPHDLLYIYPRITVYTRR